MKPKVKINLEVLQKMREFVHLAENEVSGLGLIRLDDGVFRVYDVFLLKQECGAASTDIDELAIAELTGKVEHPEDLRFWWHSHCDMGVFWSGTDEGTILEQVDVGWCLSMVLNKADEYKLRLDVQDPFPMSFDDLSYSLSYLSNESLITECKKEFDKKVTNKVWVWNKGKTLPATQGYRNYLHGKPYGWDGDDWGEDRDYSPLSDDPLENLIDSWSEGNMTYDALVKKIDAYGANVFDTLYLYAPELFSQLTFILEFGEDRKGVESDIRDTFGGMTLEQAKQLIHGEKNVNKSQSC